MPNRSRMRRLRHMTQASLDVCHTVSRQAVAVSAKRRECATRSHPAPCVPVRKISIDVEAHPLLRVAAFTTSFPEPLVSFATPTNVLDALHVDAVAPLRRDE